MKLGASAIYAIRFVNLPSRNHDNLNQSDYKIALSLLNIDLAMRTIDGS